MGATGGRNYGAGREVNSFLPVVILKVLSPGRFVILNAVKDPQATEPKKIEEYCQLLVYCYYVADPSLHSG